MVRKYKKLVKESRGSVYDMINAIEDRIDELENGYYDESVDLEEDYSTDDVRELVLYIINKAQLNNQVQSTIRNLKRKVARNMYDPDKAVDAFMYVAKDGAKMYDKEYGSYSGSSTWLNRDTLKAIATELRDYYEEQIFEDTVSESFRKGRRITTPKNMREGKSMPYVLWVLDGDDRQWKMYKGVNDARKFTAENDHDEFLDQLNTQVYPNATYYNNYIDWVVLPAGEDPETFNTYNENLRTGSKRPHRRLSESSRKKYTQAQLRKMVRDGKAEDITNYSFEEANDLYDRGYDVIGVSTGTYGINGALLQMRDTGDLMVICARNSTLMQLV